MHTSPNFGSSARRKARVEIIPLIDVIFFLLATFVLFTLSLNRIQSVPVELPSNNKGNEIDPDLVTLQVSADGTLYWNKDLIDAKEIPGRLEIYKQQVLDPHITISGDDKARFGVAVAVLDQIRLAGILKYSVLTQLRPTGK